MFYAAERLEGAYVETILRHPRRVLRRAFVEERRFTTLRLGRAVVLAKLHGEGLQAYGVDAGDLGTDNYARSRAVALSVFKDLPGIDGLSYRSRYNNGEICYALFDRVAAADLGVVSHEEFSAIPDEVDRLMRLHRAVFDTSPPIPASPPAT